MKEENAPGESGASKLRYQITRSSFHAEIRLATIYWRTSNVMLRSVWVVRTMVIDNKCVFHHYL